MVECARLHGEAFAAHHAEMQRMAHLYKALAVVGAGCDPGILSLFRGQFALLIPHGHTQSSLHTATSLHHTLAAEGIAAREERNRGLLLERHTAAGDPRHASLLLEARVNETQLAARMLLAAARALPFLQAGAHSVFDLPPGVLCGDQGTTGAKEWM